MFEWIKDRIECHGLLNFLLEPIIVIIAMICYAIFKRYFGLEETIFYFMFLIIFPISIFFLFIVWDDNEGVY